MLKNELFKTTYKTVKKYENAVNGSGKASTKALLQAMIYITLLNIIVESNAAAEYKKFCIKHYNDKKCTIDLESDFLF